MERDILDACTSCLGTSLVTGAFFFALGAVFGVVFAISRFATTRVRQVMKQQQEGAA